MNKPKTFRAKVLQALLDYQHGGGTAGKLVEELADALAASMHDGPETTSRPTGAGDFDIICDGCGEAVAEPHSWADCCATQRKRVESLCGNLAKMEDERDDARSNREATQKKLEAMTALWHLEVKEKLALRIGRDDAIRARDAALETVERFDDGHCRGEERDR